MTTTSMLSKLPPELLYLVSLYLRTTDCSNLSLTCWSIYHAVVPALFKSIRILGLFSAEHLSHLLRGCPLIKAAARHITLALWDSDFALSSIEIYSQMSSFLNLTSLRLDIHTAPLLYWMVRLDGLFLALYSRDIAQLELKITDWVDAHNKQMPATWSNAPVPYHCPPNLAVLRITISVGNMDSSRRQHQWPWLSYFDTLILASKATLTTLSLNINHNDGALTTGPSRPGKPWCTDPLFKILKQLKRLEILQVQRIDRPHGSQAHLDAALALAQPDVCPALRRIDWKASHYFLNNV
ncbi:hypothetical protein PLEOSDRAFT_156443 [Pleurotus ostreatus PC15]|uniref:F-box domain-containing protein n=1 Tax=Pleurotus ostreatus (strain PC15) TaxID=1137138 RepID=A0A067NYL5_PLEO1|nr:hypothetical protein PLEOSDRAFT_156443 [Pleurotus ostreatus PC15]